MKSKSSFKTTIGINLSLESMIFKKKKFLIYLFIFILVSWITIYHQCIITTNMFKIVCNRPFVHCRFDSKLLNVYAFFIPVISLVL